MDAIGHSLILFDLETHDYSKLLRKHPEEMHALEPKICTSLAVESQ